MTKSILPKDENNNPIAVLAPYNRITHPLAANLTEAVAAKSEYVRIFRLLTSASDCEIRVGADPDAMMTLMPNVAECIRLYGDLSLYAKGSGTLEIVEMR